MRQIGYVCKKTDTLQRRRLHFQMYLKETLKILSFEQTGKDEEAEEQLPDERPQKS